MLTQELVLKIRSCALLLAGENYQLDADGVLKRVSDILSDPKAHTDIIAQYQCLQVLLDANVSPDDIKTMPVISNEDFKRNVAIAFELNRLKFSRAEVFIIFNTWSSLNLSYVSLYSEYMRTFLSRVSGLMLRSHLTATEAMAQVLKPGTNAYFAKIPQEQIKLLLSKQAILELYLHAKAGMVMNVDYYDPKKQPEHQALHANAKFHLEHQDKVFWETDQFLSGLGFTIAETNILLMQHENVTSINALLEKIKLMQITTDKMKTLMQATPSLKFSDAQTLVLANMTEPARLSNQEFQELLSLKLNASLHITKLEQKSHDIFDEKPAPAPVILNARHAPLSMDEIQSYYNEINNRVVAVPSLIPGVSNQLLSNLLTISTAFVLVLTFLRKPAIFNTGYNFFRHNCDKVMGFFAKQTKEPTSPLLETGQAHGIKYRYVIEDAIGRTSRRH